MNLEEQIIYYRKKYWDGEAEISDSQYDQLLEALRLINPQHELLIVPEGPEDILNKVYHTVPMLSLEKKYSYDEVISWMRKVARDNNEIFAIMPKFDGIASRYYPELKILATRGDGEYGENITDKIPLIKRVDFTNFTDPVSGEIVISLHDFENNNLTKKYKTPRNMVAGIINLKESQNVDITLDFMNYELFRSYTTISELTEEAFNLYINSAKSLGYQTDGLVITIKDKEYGITLGSTNHHYRHSIAYKEQDLAYKTTLIDIILQHGKNKLTPVGIVEPIDINGVTISRVSLHNAKNLLDNDIKINDILYLIRSNDVIPYVIKSEPGINRKDIVFNNCEICDSLIQYIEPDLYCTNPNCSGNLVKKLLDACKTLEIENIGQPTIEKMVYDLDIESIVDILNLKLEDILKLEGFSTISANKLYENINSIKKGTEDYKIFAALNLKGIGSGLFKAILLKVNSMELAQCQLSELVHFDNLGIERATIIFNGIRSNVDLLKKLFDIINVIETKQIKSTVKKPTICFSGSFPNGKEYYYKIAKSKGFEIVETVTKDLNLLVTAGAMTSKTTKANKYGVPIRNLNEFLKL